MKTATSSGIKWNLDPIYQGFDHPGYKRDKELLQKEISRFSALLAGQNDQADQGGYLSSLLAFYNRIEDLYENLNSYAYSRYSADTNDAESVREINALEEIGVKLTDCIVGFRNALASMKADLNCLLDSNQDLKRYAFFINEQIFHASRQMEPVLENLAADLKRSGADAWSRMQEALISNTHAVWDEATGERKTVTELRTLAHSPDRAVRKKAFEKEREALKDREIPFAAALNGVKGAALTLDARRGFASSLERSIVQSRITEKSLKALVSVMEESLPLFRRYLKAKAKALGQDTLAFYDLFAPLPGASKSSSYSFAEAKEIIVTEFGRFSQALGDFAQKAFDKGWIDATPREGKVGGAFCISFPLAEESRVLCNFAGSIGDVSTVAHELGHAYHHEVLKTTEAALREYPMTLAETASIFSENIVSGGLLSACEPSERLLLIELFLQDATQVIVDILSRFYFERSVFEKRKEGELSAQEFNALMIEAQKAAYGDALNEKDLHPHMWAVKSHYYSADLSFYNFPYAFGLLFGLGLYSLYKKEGTGFTERYNTILRATGGANAVDVVKGAGFDIESEEFWRSGIEAIRERVDELERLI
jgi:oligoendopeptidase F